MTSLDSQVFIKRVGVALPAPPTLFSVSLLAPSFPWVVAIGAQQKLQAPLANWN
jgi:hypothetical protein